MIRGMDDAMKSCLLGGVMQSHAILISRGRAVKVR